MNEPAIYAFDRFKLDAQRRLLWSGAEEPLALSAKAFATLLFLVEHAGEVVSKGALMKAVWPDVHVEENNLNQCISQLRKVLGERPRDHRFIVTIAGSGYRFVAPVAPPNPGAATNDARAYQDYVNGWWRLTRPSGATLDEAVRFSLRAAERDPSFAPAHANVAESYALMGVFGMRAPHDVFPDARRHAAKALAIDPESADAHAIAGHIQMVYELDWPRAEASFRRALELDPRCGKALHNMALQMTAYGRFDDAMTYLRHARSLEPLAANLNANIGQIHYYAGRYGEAVAQLEATLELDQIFDHTRSLLGRALLQLGEFDRAVEQFHLRRSITVGGRADLPIAHAMRGDTAAARAALRELMQQRESGGYVPAFDIAAIHAAFGDVGPALDWIERAHADRTQTINFVGVDPVFRGLRGEPRFERLLGILGSGVATV
jgi:DNA-binding winged helix-turn-helix (wHTH) protein/Tfp pilus assembly protein PilF